MSALSSTLTTGPATPRRRTATSVWATGAGAGLVAAVATVAVAGIAHRGLDIPLTVGGKAIPLLGFAQLTFVFSLVGALIAAVMSRRASRPRHTFVIATFALTALSIVPDVLADAHTATRFVLALTHLVAAAVVIPALASRLSD